MNFLRKIYKLSPGFIKRFRRKIPIKLPVQPNWKEEEFLKWYNFLQESQWWSIERLKQYQMQQLKKLLNHAYKNVPYYKRIFDEKLLKPKNIQNFEDFRKLPYLTKDIVRGNSDNLIAKNISKENMKYVTTGGTSGKPLGFYIEERTIFIRDAFDWRQYNWAAYKFGDKCVVLRGNVVQRKENRKPAWWEYDQANNYLILSTYDMTEENLPKYVKKIEEFKPKIIQGYPSALDILARFIKENNLKINIKGNVKAILTSSENLYLTQRKLIKEIFRCPVFDLYGNSEQVVRFGECIKHEGYHNFMEYGYTEILNSKGKPVVEEGEIGEIVATGFTNYATPLIRYKTGDLVEYTHNKCSCGRKLPLIKRIEGRLQELIVTKNNNLISMAAMNMHSNVFDNVKQFQLYQDKPGKITFKIVRKNTYTQKDTECIIQELQRKIKNQININIKFVSEIPKTDRGKYKFLIQKLPIRNINEYE